MYYGYYVFMDIGHLQTLPVDTLLISKSNNDLPRSFCHTMNLGAPIPAEIHDARSLSNANNQTHNKSHLGNEGEHTLVTLIVGAKGNAM